MKPTPPNRATLHVSARDLGMLLRLCRHCAGKSQGELAMAIGYEQSRVAGLERGENLHSFALYSSAMYLLGYTLHVRKTHKPLV